MNDYFFLFPQMLYTGLVLYSWSNSVKSQAGLGLSGVFLVIITVAGGLGASALIGIPFNPSTTQILPFVALGTGVNAMFIMTQTYAELLQSAVLPEEVRFFMGTRNLGFGFWKCSLEMGLS